MKTTFAFRTLALVSLSALACLGPAAWSQGTNATRVSPPLSKPSQQPNAKSPFPVSEQRRFETRINPHAKLTVTTGLARLLSFPKNILVVYFSDSMILQVHAINSRTVAIVGKAEGVARLAVFTPRYTGDVVGQANIYEIAVAPPSTSPSVSPSGGTSGDSAPIALAVPLNTDKIARLLGRQWPSGDMSFEDMLAEEIQKRDRRIEELEKQLASK